MKMPHWPVPLGSKPIDLALERIKLLLNELDNPHKKLPPIIHVAGTNGKGSTVAFLKAIFQAAGYKVHTYTSPHLLEFNERINILGNKIDDRFLYETLEKCRIATAKLGIDVTFFEGTTAAAFQAFSEIAADVIILEVGLGGRLDATNVIEECAMSVITNIGFDHMDFLGNTIREIAFEKAGIIKNNCPTVISAQYEEAADIIFKQAQRMNSTTYIFEYDWIIQPGLYKSPQREINLPLLSLKGEHQYLNAGNAITAAINIPGFKISDANINHGLSSARWPARLQKVETGVIVNQFPKGTEFWIDGAHNQDAAIVLSEWLKSQEKKPTYMIFGMTRGRDCQSFLKYFTQDLNHLIGVLVENEPSSYGGDHVSKQAQLLGIEASSAENLEQALDMLKPMMKDQARILICGSLFLAAELLKLNKTSLD